jgi:hypothetical protein
MLNFLFDCLIEMLPARASLLLLVFVISLIGTVLAVSALT